MVVGTQEHTFTPNGTNPPAPLPSEHKKMKDAVLTFALSNPPPTPISPPFITFLSNVATASIHKPKSKAKINPNPTYLPSILRPHQNCQTKRGDADWQVGPASHALERRCIKVGIRTRTHAGCLPAKSNSRSQHCWISLLSFTCPLLIHTTPPSILYISHLTFF